jgi:hypothetical protein
MALIILAFAALGFCLWVSGYYLGRIRRERLWLQGKFDREKRLNDAIDRWHAGQGDGMPLHTYLGLTPEQYEQWLRDPDSVDVDVK